MDDGPIDGLLLWVCLAVLSLVCVGSLALLAYVIWTEGLFGP